MVVRRVPDDFWYANNRGKYTCCGGTIISDTKEAAIAFEKEYYGFVEIEEDLKEQKNEL